MDKTRGYKLFLGFCGAIVLLVALGLIAWTLPPAKIPISIKPPIAKATSTVPIIPLPTVTSSVPTDLVQYMEVTDSCGPYFDGGPCVNMRSGPGMDYPVIRKLRNGVVFRIATTTEADGRTWYEVGFDGEIHYPERVTSTWYVAADYVQMFSDIGPSKIVRKANASSTKHIVINLTEQTLYAYDGDTLFMKQPISAGLELTPTLAGAYWVYRKIPDSYMQGPIPDVSDQFYDLPGVPWDLYFSRDGDAIHGAYWHDHFGEPWSHGCVNLPPAQAKILYEWADLGTPVTVQN